MNSANKVAVNTGVQYAKMVVTIIVALYSTRLVLKAMGASDFGIYNLVAGVIAMLSFLNTSMTISTQRYLSYYMGRKDFSKLKTVFNSSVILHLIIAIIVIVLLELGGIYLFDFVLKVPPERIDAAKTAFHFMVVSTFFTINAVPYDASINAHEDLYFDAITGILDALLKLGIAFWILSSNSDKLVLYGLLTAVVTIVIRIIKSTYCFKRYGECRSGIWKSENFDKHIFKEMISFAGWNTLAAIMSVCRNQGIAVILNIFLGTMVNAAYGIANQVNAQISSFSGSLLKALNPQIIKSEGEGDRTRMLRLAMTASKFSFFLFLFFCIPLIVEMPYVLNLWLDTVPPYTIIFCRLVLIVSLILQLSNGLMIAVQSVGKIKRYTTVMSILLLLNLPISYLFLKMGFSPEYVLITAIFLESAALFARIIFAKKLTGLRPPVYLMKVLIPAFVCFAAILLVAGSVVFLIDQQSLIRLFITCAVTTIFLPGTIWFLGVDKEERKRLAHLFKSFVAKLPQRLVIKAYK